MYIASYNVIFNMLSLFKDIDYFRQTGSQNILVWFPMRTNCSATSVEDCSLQFQT